MDNAECENVKYAAFSEDGYTIYGIIEIETETMYVIRATGAEIGAPDVEGIRYIINKRRATVY